MATQVLMPRRQVELGFTRELFPEGTHICYLYSDDDERMRFMSEYVASGVQNREAVTYIVDAAEDALRKVVDERGITAAANEHQDQLDLKPALETYCPGGHFDPDQMLGKLRNVYASHPPSCVGARLAGEMTWALHHLPGTERLVEYEGRINDLLKTYPLTTVCQYDTRKFNGATIFELLNVHPIMVVHGQIMRNPFYVWPSQSQRAEDGQSR